MGRTKLRRAHRMFLSAACRKEGLPQGSIRCPCRQQKAPLARGRGSRSCGFFRCACRPCLHGADGRPGKDARNGWAVPCGGVPCGAVQSLPAWAGPCAVCPCAVCPCAPACRAWDRVRGAWRGHAGADLAADGGIPGVPEAEAAEPCGDDAAAGADGGSRAEAGAPACRARRRRWGWNRPWCRRRTCHSSHRNSRRRRSPQGRGRGLRPAEGVSCVTRR